MMKPGQLYQLQRQRVFNTYLNVVHGAVTRHHHGDAITIDKNELVLTLSRRGADSFWASYNNKYIILFEDYADASSIRISPGSGEGAQWLDAMIKLVSL